MLGERSTVFNSIFLNPMVWIGLVLTFFTLSYGQDDVFGVFFAPETYRNLAIGSAVYVGLFGRKYTDGMRKLDWNQTLGGVIEAMLTILVVWFFSVFAIVHYQRGGEAYSDLIRQRYKTEANQAPAAAPNAAEVEKTLKNVDEAINKMDIKAGQKYRVTPHEDGSFTVEVE